MRKFFPAYRLHITLDEGTTHLVETLAERENDSLTGTVMDLIRDGLKQCALTSETTTTSASGPSETTALELVTK